MGQEFIINSTAIEDKINQLLPSQGGFGAGVDFSASTTIIPIVNLTETAEGSTLRQDLQKSFSQSSITAFNISNTATTVINTTGYWRVFGNSSNRGTGNCTFSVTDGVTSKIISLFVGDADKQNQQFDFIVYLKAGDSFLITSGSTNITVVGCVRQIADINGNLVNP
tara:strand:+ start:1645 stop:2145 length:501 start_codon:yes stop_codon:yes gene_type:complete